MSNKKRLLAVLLCAVFLLTVICASAFLATHLEHLHTGDGCVTCAAIHTAGQIITGLRHSALLLALLTVLLTLMAAVSRTVRGCLRRTLTLCSLKVRLTE